MHPHAVGLLYKSGYFRTVQLCMRCLEYSTLMITSMGLAEDFPEIQDVDILDTVQDTATLLQAIKWCIQCKKTDVLSFLLKKNSHKLSVCKSETAWYEILECLILPDRSSLFRECLLHMDKTIFNTKTGVQGKNMTTKLLCKAATNGASDLIPTLVKHGADINTSYFGKPLLHVVLSLGLDVAAKTLVKEGADVNILDRRGDNCISQFATLSSENNKKCNLITWLIDNGVDMRHRNNAGKEPIHVAAATSFRALLQMIRKGCDVNATDTVHGDTPLHIACNRCNHENIILLIKYGANFNARNNEGDTPLAKLLQFVCEPHDFHSRTRLKMAGGLIKLGFKMYEPTNVSVTVTSKNSKVTVHKTARGKIYDLYESVYKQHCTVPSLQHLCRMDITKYISGKDHHNWVFKLDISHFLKKYLMFSSLEIEY